MLLFAAPLNLKLSEHSPTYLMLPLLIVDDSREDALLVQRVLSQCKILNPVFLLNSGDACLEYFEASGQFADRTLPCFVFLDMVMAPMSGLDVLAALRSDGWLAKGSMVIMLSGLTDIRSVHEGYQLGARTFLIKPLLPEDLMQMVNSIPTLSAVTHPGGYELALSASIGSHKKVPMTQSEPSAHFAPKYLT